MLAVKQFGPTTVHDAVDHCQLLIHSVKDAVLEPFTIMSKNLRCGSIPYNGCEKHLFCNGVLQNKVKDNVTMSCCGTQSYDKNKQILLW